MRYQLIVLLFAAAVMTDVCAFGYRFRFRPRSLAEVPDTDGGEQQTERQVDDEPLVLYGLDDQPSADVDKQPQVDDTSLPLEKRKAWYIHMGSGSRG